MERETSDFLFSVLERFFEIPENEKQSAKRLATVQSLKPNEYLVRQGERWGQIGVVYKGIFRVFSIDMAGNERIINFRLKGDISGIYMPYFTDSGKDIWFSIQALTECAIINLPPESYQLLIHRHPCWKEIESAIFFDHYLEMENRVRSLLIEDATTRYLNFRNEYPEIEQHISLFHVASYLGITPVSLSRIRSIISKRK